MMLERLLTSAQKPLHRNRFTKFQHKLSFSGMGDSRNAVRRFDFYPLLVFTTAVLLLGGFFCIAFLPSDVLLKGIKAIVVGVMAVYFSWEVVYFDSTTPGIHPPSPLSPRKIGEAAEHTIHTSYLFSVVNGMLFTVMAFLWF